MVVLIAPSSTSVSTPKHIVKTTTTQSFLGGGGSAPLGLALLFRVKHNSVGASPRENLGMVTLKCVCVLGGGDWSWALGPGARGLHRGALERALGVTRLASRPGSTSRHCDFGRVTPCVLIFSLPVSKMVTRPPSWGHCEL